VANNHKIYDTTKQIRQLTSPKKVEKSISRINIKQQQNEQSAVPYPIIFGESFGSLVQKDNDQDTR
jgi:hypothetical protein